MDSPYYKAQMMAFIMAIFPEGHPEGINAVQISCNGVDFDLMFDPNDVHEFAKAVATRKAEIRGRKGHRKPQRASGGGKPHTKTFEERLNDFDRKMLKSLRISLEDEQQ